MEILVEQDITEEGLFQRLLAESGFGEVAKLEQYYKDIDEWVAVARDDIEVEDGAKFRASEVEDGAKFKASEVEDGAKFRASEAVSDHVYTYLLPSCMSETLQTALLCVLAGTVALSS